MKDQILKIAKVKSEKEFYKKYPTEEAFMAKHGKAFKKAEMGAAMVEEQLNQLTDFGNPREAAYGDVLNAPVETPAYQNVSLSNVQDNVMANQMGITRKQYDLQQQQAEDRNNAEIIAAGNKGGGGGIGDLVNLGANLIGKFGGEEGSKLGDTIGQFADAFDDGGEIPTAQGGSMLSNVGDWFTGKGKYAASQIGSGGTPANFTGGGSSVFNQSSNPSMLGGNTLPNVGIPGNTAANSMAIAPGNKPDVTAITGKLTGQGGLPGAIGKSAGFINKGLDKLGGAGNVISSATNIAKGIDQMKQQKNAIDVAHRDEVISDLNLTAASGPKQIEKRNYLTPYDQRFAQNQVSPSYGTGWNPLTAEDGAQLKGYSNTYNDPYTLYSNLGYEPLNDSSIKQYEDGGYVSHNWTPQVITHFGELTADDYYKASKEMRTGGSIRDNDMFGSDYYPVADNGYGKWRKKDDSGEWTEIKSTLPPQESPKYVDLSVFTQNKSNNTNRNGNIDDVREFLSAKYGKEYFDKQNPKEVYSYYTQKGDSDILKFNRVAQEGESAKNQLHRIQMRRPFLNLLGKKQPMERWDNLDEAEAQKYLQQMNDAMPEGLPGYQAPNQMATGGAMNGRLATHWGGEAEDVSYNPYSAGTGITSMLSGNSHSEYDGQGNTGIGIGYAAAGAAVPKGVDAEAQRNEPVLEVLGPDGQPTAHVAGKIKIPKYVAKQLGDESAEGQTFQKYLGKEIVKREQKANKKIAEGIELINKSNPNNPIENTTFMAGTLKKQGGEDILKELARIKEGAMHWQAAFNEAAPEFGYDDSAKFVEDTNKGKIDLKKAIMAANQKTAAYGMDMGDPEKDPNLPKISKKDYDEITALYKRAEKASKGKENKFVQEVQDFQKRYHELFPKHARYIISQEPLTAYAMQKGLDINNLEGNQEGKFGKRTRKYFAGLEAPTTIDTTTMPGRTVTVQTTPPPQEEPGGGPAEIPKGGGIPWQYGADQLMDYFARPLRKDLDLNQLAGEMYALSSNQLEPVRAQKVNPLLLNPYQISLQDQMNANQADFNSLVRQVGDNPAALTALAAQKYRANSGVKAEEFRTNQGIANNIYNQNRRILEDNAFKNMDIMNNQWMLQEKAKANTKATNIAALNSIADKYAKNASENFAAAITQNLYPKFRYNAEGKAYVVPSFTSPVNMPTIGAANTSTASQTKIPGFQDFLNRTVNSYSTEYNKKKKTETGANGLIVKNFKKI